MIADRNNFEKGNKIETLLTKILEQEPSCIDALKLAAGMADDVKFTSAEKIGGKKRKADVVVYFGESSVKVSVKSFNQKPGYNQIERTSIEDFCKRNRISKEGQNFLTKAILRKAQAKNRDGFNLINEDEWDFVRQMLKDTSVGEASLMGMDHPDILAIYSGIHKRFHFYDMRRDVMPLVKQNKISFTKRGGNIVIGKYIVIQRKGSQAGEQGISGDRTVDDPKHKSNDVQIKMRLFDFFNEVNPIASLQL